MKVIEIEGIGPAYAGKLEAAGISSTDDLLAKGASRKGREELAAASGSSEARILQWVNHVDLMRLDGVGSEYSDLLEAAGVDSCAELARRNIANLHAGLTAANDEKKLVRQLPSETMVGRWIEQAKTLDKVVTH